MTNDRQLTMPTDRGITVTVVGPGGIVLDRIEDVSLGDRIEAARHGRESLHTAALWAHIAHKKYDRLVDWCLHAH